MSNNSLIELKGVNCYYSNVSALHNIDLAIEEGEVHAIVGERGSGKTTLANILGGLLQPTSGRIYWQNTPFHYLPLRKARDLGIRIVCQDNFAIDPLTIANSFLLSNSNTRRILKLKRKKDYNEISNFIRNKGFNIDLYKRIEDLSLVEKVLIETLKGLYAAPKLLILDETLQLLDGSASGKIYFELKKLTKNNCSVISMTDKIEDIDKYADRVTIIRDGRILLTDSVRNVDKLSLIRVAYTQTKKAESTTEANREFYNLLKFNQAILENLPVNLIVIDRYYRVKLINENGKEYFDIKGDRFFDFELSELFPESNNVMSLVKEALEEDMKKTLFATSIVLKGIERKCDIITYPIFDESMKIGYIIIFHDITEVDKLHEQINLAEKLSTVGLLAAGVAHEINNPLDIILNCLDYFKLKLKDKELIENLLDIEEEISSISQIVGNFMSLTKNSNSSVEEFEINELIYAIVHLVGHYASNRKIKINVKKNCEKIILKGNQTEIKHVLLNLIKNSFDAIHESGEIYISSDVIKIDRNLTAQIILQDTGKGVREEQLEKIFQPFFSTKSDTSYNIGLGLYTSQSIIKKHGGAVIAENVQNGGLKITLNLPAMEQEGEYV